MSCEGESEIVERRERCAALLRQGGAMSVFRCGGFYSHSVISVKQTTKTSLNTL